MVILKTENSKDVISLIPEEQSSVLGHIRTIIGDDADIFADLGKQNDKWIWVTEKDKRFSPLTIADNDTREIVRQAVQIRLSKIRSGIADDMFIGCDANTICARVSDDNIFYYEENGMCDFVITDWACQPSCYLGTEKSSMPTNISGIDKTEDGETFISSSTYIVWIIGAAVLWESLRYIFASTISLDNNWIVFIGKIISTCFYYALGVILLSVAVLSSRKTITVCASVVATVILLKEILLQGTYLLDLSNDTLRGIFNWISIIGSIAFVGIYIWGAIKSKTIYKLFLWFFIVVSVSFICFDCVCGYKWNAFPKMFCYKEIASYIICCILYGWMYLLFATDQQKSSSQSALREDNDLKVCGFFMLFAIVANVVTALIAKFNITGEIQCPINIHMNVQDLILVMSIVLNVVALGSLVVMNKKTHQVLWRKLISYIGIVVYVLVVVLYCTINVSWESNVFLIISNANTFAAIICAISTMTFLRSSYAAYSSVYVKFTVAYIIVIMACTSIINFYEISQVQIINGTIVINSHNVTQENVVSLYVAITAIAYLPISLSLLHKKWLLSTMQTIMLSTILLVCVILLAIKSDTNIVIQRHELYSYMENQQQ